MANPRDLNLIDTTLTGVTVSVRAQAATKSARLGRAVPPVALAPRTRRT